MDSESASYSDGCIINEGFAEAPKLPVKDRLVRVLDHFECQVEKMRKEAARLEEEKDMVLCGLDAFVHSERLDDLSEFEKDDLLKYADHLLTRCQSVEVKVRTNRDHGQEEALFQVNHLIDGLVINVRSDPDGTKMRCLSYMNACLSSMEEEKYSDKQFENILLGCTIDDQKRVKKRLQGLLNYFDNSSLFFSNPDVVFPDLLNPYPSVLVRGDNKQRRENTEKNHRWRIY